MKRSAVLVLLAACGGGGGEIVDAAGSTDVVSLDTAAAPDASGTCGTLAPPLAQITGTEGLAITGDGAMYFSQTGGVGRWEPGDAGATTDWMTLPGTTTVWGMAIDSTGILYVASPPHTSTPGTIWRIDTEAVTPAPTVLDDLAGAPNGLVLGPDHAVYYSDFSAGQVWRVDDAGNRTQVTTSAIAQANGLLFDQDGTLLVASYATGNIVRLTLDTGHHETGRATAFTGTGSPDGLARDQLGRIYVTDNGGGELLRITPPATTPEPALLTGVASAANMAFSPGCPDLFVTSSGALRKVTVGAGGTP